MCCEKNFEKMAGIKPNDKIKEIIENIIKYNNENNKKEEENKEEVKEEENKENKENIKLKYDLNNNCITSDSLKIISNYLKLEGKYSLNDIIIGTKLTFPDFIQIKEEVFKFLSLFLSQFLIICYLFLKGK